MEKNENYYSFIGVSRTASADEIRQAYKKMALKCHPDKYRVDETGEKFKQLQEAYTVLSNPVERHKYNISLGNPNLDDIQKLFFCFHRQAAAGNYGVPRQFSHHRQQQHQQQQRKNDNSSNNNNGNSNSCRGGRWGNRWTWTPSSDSRSPPPPPPPHPPPPPRQQSPPKKEKDPPVQFDLWVTLEELCRGTTKVMRIEREIRRASGHMDQEVERVQIEVKPGWKEGTKITFPEKGDRLPGRIPADVCFVLKQTPHPVFKRNNGFDIVCTRSISLADALRGKIEVPSLDGQRAYVDLGGKPITPGLVHRFVGRGLPDWKTVPSATQQRQIAQNEGVKRGDLIVHFDVLFPKRVSLAVMQLADALDSMLFKD